MLYVFCGNDTVGVREKAHDFVAGYEEKGFTLERIDEENFAPGVLSDASGAVSLFGTQTLYVIDTPSTNKEFYDAVVEALPTLGESENNFVLIEGNLLAPEKKKFAKYSNRLEEIKGETTERFNTFALADALAKKDKKTLWLLITQATAARVSAEEIIGILWWQLKSLRLAAQTKSAAEAGMKDFPYNKAKRALGNFKDDELEALSHQLLAVYHEGHQGRAELDLALEAWALRL